jgi:ABC-type glycerol-3-phosphate transport system substrate-binding protein
MHNLRRIISIILTAALVFLTACQKADSYDENAPKPKFFLNQKEYPIEPFLEEQFIIGDTVLSTENGVSMVVYDYSETDVYTYSILNIADDGAVTVNEIYSGNETRNYLGLFYDGGVYTLFYRNFISGNMNFESELQLNVDKYDSDFNLLSTVNSGIFAPIMRTVYVIKGGEYFYVYVEMTNTVTRLDSDLNKVDSVDIINENGSTSEIKELISGSDGNVYIVCRDDYYLKLIMYNSDSITLSDEIIDAENFITGSENYLLYCLDDTYIYGITPDGIVEKMMVASELENSSANWLFRSVLHNGVYRYFDISDKLIELEFTVKLPPEDTREILTITVLTQVEEDLVEAVSYYNRTNLDYRIVIDDKAYQSNDDYHEAFNKQILDNTVGDVIIPSRYNDQDTTYTQKGVYEDLYPFLDADEEMSREDFFPNVLSSMEIDGHLYGIWRLFTVQTYFAPEGSLPPTYQNIITLQSENPDLGIIPFGSVNTYVLDEIMQYNRGYFDSADKIGGEAMRQALLIADKYPNPKEATDEVYPSDAENRYYYYSSFIYDAHSYVVSSKIKMQTPAVPVGNPIPEGEPQNYISPGLRLCINSSSDKKEAAWEFIKYYLTIPFGGNGISGMTVLKTEFDKIKSLELLENEKLIAEFGADYSNSTVGFGSGGSYSVPLSTEEDFDALESLINSSVYPDVFEGELLDIIEEEAEPYLLGQKSIDEVLDIIKNRAGIYIAEKS